jgi:hypothetical protein
LTRLGLREKEKLTKKYKGRKERRMRHKERKERQAESEEAKTETERKRARINRKFLEELIVFFLLI